MEGLMAGTIRHTPPMRINLNPTTSRLSAAQNVLDSFTLKKIIGIAGFVNHLKMIKIFASKYYEINTSCNKKVKVFLSIAILIKITCFFFFCFSVPTWGPAGITAWNTSSTSILLSWKPLADPYYLHGILRGYVIACIRVDGLLPAEHANTSSSNLSLELGGLDEYVEYRFEVRAFTIKGAGPFNNINCLTDQDGKAEQICLQNFTETWNESDVKSEFLDICFFTVVTTSSNFEGNRFFCPINKINSKLESMSLLPYTNKNKLQQNLIQSIRMNAAF